MTEQMGAVILAGATGTVGRPLVAALLKAGYELEYDRSDFDNYGLTGPLAGPIVPNPGLIDRFGPNGAPDINKLVLWWPVEQDVKVLQALVAHRDQIKQIIYEVTGLSDILRGATEASHSRTSARHCSTSLMTSTPCRRYKPFRRVLSRCLGSGKRS